MRQQVLSDGPAFTLFSNQVFLVGDRVIKEGFAKRGAAADQFDGASRHALLRHIEQHKADTLVLGARVVGAHKTKYPVRLICIGRPDFLAVDHIMITLVFGFGREAGQVRARVWFRVTLTPANFTAHDFRQMFKLLLLRTKVQQSRAEHGNTKTAQCRAGTDGRHLLSEDSHLFFT